MKIEGGKTYLTKGDYIVEIVSDRDGFFATQRTSPGTLCGCTVVGYGVLHRMDWAKKHGWLYKSSGKITQSSHSLYSELEIVAEYPYELVDPPEGFMWKGGFPKVSDFQKGDFYIAYETMISTYQHASEGYYDSQDLTPRDVIGKKRIVLEKIETSSPKKQEITTASPEPIVASPQEQYYIANRKSIFTSGIYWVKKSGVWHFTNQHVADVTDYSRDELFQRGINNKDLIPCSKEEALAHFEKATKKEVVPFEEQYYLPKSNVSYLNGKYYVKKEDGMYFYIGYRQEEIKDTSPDDFWANEIQKANLIPCKKDEALAKIEKSEQYYVPTDMYAGGQNKYFVKRGDVWARWDWFSKKEIVDTRGESFWAIFIADGKIKPSTKEEALIRVAITKQEVVVSAPQESWPKYYVRTDGFLVDSAIAVKRTSENGFNLVGKNGFVIGSVNRPWDSSVDVYVRNKKWKEITTEEADKLIYGGKIKQKSQEIETKSPQEQYYIATGSPFNFAVYWMKQFDSWYYTNEYRKNAIDLSSDKTFQEGIDRKTLIPCSKEEALAHFEKVTNKKEVNTPPKKEKLHIVVPQLTKSTVSLPVSSPKEVKMNTFVSIVKSVGNSALRAAKHVYVEPAVIVGGHIKRSLRYVVFFGTIAGAIYGVNNPEKLKKNLMAYMPKVTIEAPEIMK